MMDKIKSLEQAIELFSRIHSALSSNLHFCQIRLEYVQEGGLLGLRYFEIAIDSWGIHWVLKSEKDWQDYMVAHGFFDIEE